jgi:hypothetical protein
MRCGTSAQNTAQLWLTLFFVDGRPAENMTLHGAHDFGSGGQIGSVSAASTAFSGASDSSSDASGRR